MDPGDTAYGNVVVRPEAALRYNLSADKERTKRSPTTPKAPKHTGDANTGSDPQEPDRARSLNYSKTTNSNYLRQRIMSQNYDPEPQTTQEQPQLEPRKTTHRHQEAQNAREGRNNTQRR